MPDYSRDADLVPVLFIFPTIETCFNCFGTCSSDAKEKIKKDDKNAREIQKLRNLSRPPPPFGGEGGVAKMAPVPEGEMYANQNHKIYHISNYFWRKLINPGTPK